MWDSGTQVVGVTAKMYIKMILPRYGLAYENDNQTLPGTVLACENCSQTIPRYLISVRYFCLINMILHGLLKYQMYIYCICLSMYLFIIQLQSITAKNCQTIDKGIEKNSNLFLSSIFELLMRVTTEKAAKMAEKCIMLVSLFH